MNVRSLRQLDLNLLLAFDALTAEGSVTGAARRIGLSQPAMSNALARLRDALADPLFVRHGRTLVASSEALRLAPIVRRALEQLEAGLFGSVAFDPALAEGAVVLALSDYWHFALLPELAAILEREAPALSLRVVDVGEEVLEAGLASGRVDAAIYLSSRESGDLRSQNLIEDGYACVVRRDHPHGRSRFSLADFAACRQVMLTPRGPWADRLSSALSEAGLRPRLALETAHVQVALEIVARTDYLAVLPQRIARRAARSWQLRAAAPPADVGRFSLSLYWHSRTDRDPLRSWVRARIVELAKRCYLDPAAPLPRPAARRKRSST